MGPDNQFDYIIIGGGTAGCLLANRLSADRRLRVLLIEAGRKDDYHWVHLPLGHLHCLHHPRTDWGLHTTPQAGLGGRSLAFPRAKTLGGSSSTHAMSYLRGQAHVYDQWAQATGDDTWCWANVQAAFARHTSHWRDQPRPPKRVEWRVEPQRMRWPVLDAALQAAQQAGLPLASDLHTGSSEGVAYVDVTHKDGLRWNAAQAFLRPTCYGRPNFELWTMAQATRLLTARQANGQLRCTGVQVCTGEGTFETVYAQHEVLLCAGPIHSPHLLQLSGIGDAGALHAAGIALVHDLPGVGRNLQDLLQLRCTFQVQGATTLNNGQHSLWARARMALQYAWGQRGPMASAGAPLAAFARSLPSSPQPDVLLQVQPFSRDSWAAPLHPFSAFTASATPLAPSSRGSVQARSPRFDDAPAIDPQYLSTPHDQQTAIDSLRLLQRIVQQPALAAWRPTPYPPLSAPAEDAWLRHARWHSSTWGHAVGTTAMGRSTDTMAVLDSQLRVRGIDGLRVVGASAMPSAPGGDGCSPTLMLAEKAAGWIRAARQGGVATAPAAAPPTVATSAPAAPQPTALQPSDTQA